jgi:YD repeat-containing protein
MRKQFAVCLCFALILIAPCALQAQNYVYAIGNQPFSTQIPIENGFINVNNGDIYIEIPLAQHPQRGNLKLNERLVYDSRIWKIISNGGYSWQPTNVPNSTGGWRFVSGLETGSVQEYAVSEDMDCYGGNPSGNQIAYYNNYFYWTDPTGVAHWFQGYTQQPNSTFCSGSSIQYDLPNAPTMTGVDVDGSGYSISVVNYGSATVYDSNGDEVYPNVIDPNGNEFTQDSQGNLIDTLGRTPVKISTGTSKTGQSQTYYDVLGYNGALNRYTVTYESISYNTSFGQLAVNEANGSFNSIQSILLPDNTSYLFSYDSGTSKGNYGELTSVTLPTGGVINYTYTNFLDSFQNQNRWVNTRVKDGGTTTFTPATITNCSNSAGCQEQMTVTAPAPNGSDTVYTFTLDPGSIQNASSWNTGIAAYQGTGKSRTELKSTATQYTYGATTLALGVYQGPTAYTATTTLNDVSLSTMSATTIFEFGKPSDVKQWDYYSGAPPSTPLRETVYAYCDGNIASLTVKDGTGHQLSQTSTTFDQYPTTPSGGLGPLVATSDLPNHVGASGSRCNPTTTSQWINTGGTLTTTATYNDAGDLLTSTDPNGTTTYGYDSTKSAYAYVNSITPPTPSSAVTLTSSSTYDFSTGLITSAKDPNGTTTSYTNYDDFGRAQEVDTMDINSNLVGKKTALYYTDSPSYHNTTDVDTNIFQSATSPVNSWALYDTYGRPSRSATGNGQGTNPWYQQDTCYNANGQPAFQSYAYQGAGFPQTAVCSGAGDTTTYDALGRVLSVAHGDGTSVGYKYTGRASETTDENGVARITQTDALGRVTYVCEVSSKPLSSGDTPAPCGLDISATGFLTTYAYTTDSSLNQVTTVTQGAQTRVTKADSLGRTVYVSEPERGVTTYSYAYSATPGLGLTVTRQRPTANCIAGRPCINPVTQQAQSSTTTTTTQYDAVGRVVSVGYDDGITPAKWFVYDVPASWKLQSPQSDLLGRLSFSGVAK